MLQIGVYGDETSSILDPLKPRYLFHGGSILTIGNPNSGLSLGKPTFVTNIFFLDDKIEIVSDNEFRVFSFDIAGHPGDQVVFEGAFN